MMVVNSFANSLAYSFTLDWKPECQLADVEERHDREVKQQKEIWASAEKIRRDKWIAEKTKAIKESTVRGLEPEIQRMLAVSSRVL
jgi:hypothetical protein